MGETRTLLIDVAGRLGLGDEVQLLEALSHTATRWAELAGQVDGFASAVALLRAAINAPDDAAVEKAFVALGAADRLEDIRRGSAALRSLLDRMPDALSKLLEPVGSFREADGTRDTGLIALPILDRTVSTGRAAVDGSDGYSLSLGAKASIEFEAGDTWPYSDPLPGPLLRIALAGGLKPSGSASLPFGGSGLSVKASAEAACALEYYFAPADPQQLYVLAAGERIGRLVDPFDFDAVWEAFNASDLAGLHYVFEGSASASVAVSIADAATLAGGIKADLAATVSVGLDLKGSFFLTLRPGPRNAASERQLSVVLSRERGSGSTFSAGLGAIIDLGALAKRVHALLVRALGEWDQALATIKPFLAPGTWIQSKAAALISSQAERLVDDERLAAALSRDLQGVVGIGAPERSELVAWVREGLAGVIDRATGWAEDQLGAKGRAADALARLLPAFAEEQSRTLVESAVGDLVAHVSDSLEAEVSRIFEERAQDFGAALKQLGAVSSKAVGSADAALAGVRQLIGRYDALFRKVVKATEDAARAKVSIAVQIEEGVRSSAKVEIAGTFLSRSDRSAAIFRDIVTGRLSGLIDLLDGEAGSSDFVLDRDRSSLLRVAGRSSRFGVDVVLFGFGVTGGDLLSAEASVLVDGTGKVQVDAKASLRRRFEALDAEREIELVSSFALVRSRQLADAAAPPEADRSTGLSVTMGHLDEGLKRHEVERFVSSLVDAGLVPPASLPLAQSTFTRWAGNPGSNGKLSGALQLKLALDRRALGGLLGLDVTPSGPLPAQRRQAIVRLGFDALRRGPSQEAAEIAATAAFLAKRFPKRTLDELLSNQAKTRGLLAEQVTGSLIPKVPAQHEAFVAASRMANGLAEMVAELRSIYFSTPEDRADKDPLTWSPRDYRDGERRAVRAVQEWLQLNNVLFWTDSKVHPRTIAFFRTVAELAGLDPTTSTSLIAWRRDADAEPETIVLSAAAGAV